MDTPTPPMRVLAVHDGRAGNARQATALAQALAFAATPEEAVLHPRAPWRWLAPRRLPLAARGFDAGTARRLAAPPALAVGCGRQAALATRLLRERGSTVVQVLDPRIDPGHWDLLVVPGHDRLRGGNVITLLGSLHPVDEDWLARARAGFDLFGQLPGPRTALLLGGPTRAAGDGRALGTELARLGGVLRAEGGSLLATTSRRTPAAWRALLREHLDGIPGVRWFAPAEGPAGEDNPYPGLLGWADRIVCSGDSVNMLSEACATRAPVFVCGMTQARGRLAAFHAALRERDRVRAVDDALAHWTVEPLRETARVAAEVRARLQAAAAR